MTGIELIAEERLEQIYKHQRTIEDDAKYNSDGQLIEAMFLLIASLAPDNYNGVKEPPDGWDETVWHYMLQKSEADKIKIVGAFAAAELDRINYINQENNK